MKQENDALSLITVLLPALMTLLGVGGLNSAGIIDIRERYQWVADALVYGSAFVVLLAMIAAVYPLTQRAPFTLLTSSIRNRLTARRQRRAFQEWVTELREYLEFMLAIDVVSVLDGAQQATYGRLRRGLLRLEAEWQREVATFVHNHLFAQWTDYWSKLDARVSAKNRFFPLYAAQECASQFVDMSIDSKQGESTSNGHHFEMTLTSVWDGLSRYSVSRGWGDLAVLHRGHESPA